MGDYRDVLRAKKELWTVLRSAECRTRINQIQEITSLRYIEGSYIGADLEADCWKLSEKLYQKCEVAYEKVVEHLKRSAEIPEQVKDVRSVLDFFEEAGKKGFMSILPRLARRMSEQGRVWEKVKGAQKAELGSPLAPEYLPPTFKRLVWDKFKKVYNEVEGGTPQTSDLCKCIEHSYIDRAIKRTIRYCGHLRFISHLLDKGAGECLKRLSEARFENDEILKSLSNEVAYIESLLSMFIAILENAHEHKKYFEHAESLMDELSDYKEHNDKGQGIAWAKRLWKEGKRGKEYSAAYAGMLIYLVPNLVKKLNMKGKKPVNASEMKNKMKPLTDNLRWLSQVSLQAKLIEADDDAMPDYVC